ncbi:DUF389 domain-containing protein [Cyanobium sp. T1B-Tous]|jgi:uncharacterized hydrophobic protein (TIGR00271 family)|uniref:DUF389 domain-containing protein n=1 Tax=Cyanobium sp. T1B-Tous TaxID=2823721 RepID=UPI0020CE5DB3|nr:DUF389 domain-containing protein [Cyanobium sp. T1B-Tous]MCP9807220.1 DUF389 domain-containing protein [Cyanobium sp. T1B-Tous]
MARNLAELLHGGPVTAAEVERISDTLIFEPGRPGPKFLKFVILLVLASAIASFGLLGDSVAAVIGAMIVAPLMLPIMGLAFSISLGDRPRILNSLLVSLAGIAIAVVVGFLLTLPVAGLLHPQTIPQVMVRTAPHLLDLMAALATGVAGAFALARRDVSDTLPGVAIAVSLVPPLANVGILLAFGEPTLASGSLLLFITNYIAILLTGAAVFALMGFRQAATGPFDARARRQALAIALGGLLAITIPLAITSERLIVTNRITVHTAALAREWLRGSGYSVESVDGETADGSVRLLLAGSGSLPPVDRLEQRTRRVLAGRPLQVKVLQGSSFSLMPKRP